MQRFVYNPRVEAFISLSSTGQIIDISDDIVSGEVIRRINQASEASIVLQNKDGRYTRSQARITPMDRIIIRMSRVGDPFLVFSGYVDEVPYFQLYPGDVTIRCTCPIKLLMNTYFDPGLPAVTSFFESLGFSYNASTGSLYDNNMSTQNVLGNLDINFGVGEVLIETMHTIGGWNRDNIVVESLPDDFLTTVASSFLAAKTEQEAEAQQGLTFLTQLFGMGNDGGQGAGTTSSNTSGTGASSGTATGGGTISPASGGHLAFADAVAQATGLDAGVLVAWANSEGGLYYNDMNLSSNGPNASFSGVPIIGTYTATGGTGSFSKFATPADGVTEFVYWIENFTNYAGIKNSAGQSPQAQIQAIVDSPWDAGHYGSSAAEIAAHGIPSGHYSGPHLFADYNSLNLGSQATQPSTPASGSSTSGTGMPQAAQGTPASTSTTSPTSNSAATGVYSSPFSSLAGINPERIDQGVDYAFSTTPDLLAIGNGIVTGIIPNWFAGAEGQNQPFVWYELLDGDQKGAFVYYAEGINVAVTVGQRVVRGQKIGTYTNDGGTGLEIGYATQSGSVIDPYNGRPDGTATDGGKRFANFLVSLGVPILTSDLTRDGANPGTGASTTVATGLAGVTNSTSATAPLTIEDVRDTALQTNFAFLQLSSNDQGLSLVLTGEYALANDVPLMNWISTIVPAGGRDYMSLPDGRFFAFFADPFGWFGRNPSTGQPKDPYLRVTDMELIDLTIQRSDQNIVTHLFTVGSSAAPGGVGNIFNYTQSDMIASVEEAAFPNFINVSSDSPDDPLTPEAAGTFDPVQFLNRYGPRPLVNDAPDLSSHLLIWMVSWKKFTELWAQQYTATASMTFLPEIMPGMLVEFGSTAGEVGLLTMYVDGCTHSFNMSSGFTTSASLSAPAAINSQLSGLPNAIVALPGTTSAPTAVTNSGGLNSG